MENEKKAYQTPEVTKVEFDASDRITGSCSMGIFTECNMPIDD